MSFFKLFYKDAGVITRSQMRILVAIVFISLCSPAVKAGIFSRINPLYSEILGKIEKGNTSFFWDEPRYPEILQLPDELLESFIRKRRPTFVNFDIDLLYSKMARDEKYTYTFYVDFDYMSKNFRQCIISKNENSVMKDVKSCREKILTCLGKKDVKDVDSDDLSSCMNKNKECEAIKKLDNGTTLSISYCEKLYGRKLQGAL